MALIFPFIGTIIMLYAKHIKYKYRRRMAYCIGVCLVSSGFSRGLIEMGWNDTWVNAILKNISGLSGMVFAMYMPVGLKELMSIGTIEDTREDLKRTKEAVEKLTDISEKINIRNPR